MLLDRRDLLKGVGALAAGAARADFSGARAAFPWSETEVFLNNAGWHPIGVHSIRAMEKYLEYKSKGPGDDREDFGGAQQHAVKTLFARIINAKPSEIAFVQSTLVGENLVRQGLGIPQSGGNLVTDELHYEGSLYMYQSLKKQGLDVRIVKPRNWRIDIRDMEKVVDRNTRLVAISLVSYLNGYRHDAKAVTDLAHAHGAYVYADIIQAAGAVPIDVRALGLDFCACSGYKWLMGDRGLGYLFVREELQGEVVKRTQYGDRQFREFHNHFLPYDTPGPDPVSWQPASGAGSYYEVGNISNIAAAAQSASLAYILNLGVENILAHAGRLTARIRQELPRKGYPCITPENNPTPIVSFVVKDPEGTRHKLRRAGVTVKIEWHHMRVSPSVYNSDADVDKLLNAV